jgi:transposase
VFLAEQKKKNFAIAREVKCKPHSVARVLNKYKQTGTVDDEPPQGRKRKTSREEDKKICKKAKQGKSAPKIARELSQSRGNSINERTVRRRLKERKFFYLPKKKKQRLSKVHKERRVEYATQMEKTDWKTALFTDEKSFWLGDSTTHAWQQLDDRIEEEYERYTPKLHVWGGVGYYFKTDLYFFETNMDAGLYQDIIAARIPPKYVAPDCPKKKREKWYWVQDNDPKHTAKGSMNLLRVLTKNRIYRHPANSPDFNIMEDAWSYLDRRVKESRVTTISGLKQKLKQLWDELPWEEFRPSVTSMPRRLQQCLDRDGARTDY